MKKLKILCAALLTIGLFTACKGPSGGDNNSGGNPDVKPSNEEYEEEKLKKDAKDFYNKIIGTRWETPNYSEMMGNTCPRYIEFKENSIIFDEKEFFINLDEDIIMDSKFDDRIYITMNNTKYCILYDKTLFPLNIELPIQNYLIRNYSGSWFTLRFDGENELYILIQKDITNTQTGEKPNSNNLPSGKYNITGNPDGYLEFSDNQLKFYYNNTLKNTYNISFESNKMSLSYSAAGYTFTSVFEFTESDDTFTFKKTDDTGLSLIAQWTHNYSMEEITLYK